MLLSTGQLFGTVAGGGGGTHPLDGLSPTAAWSFSRNLLSSFSSSKYSVTGSPARVTSLSDQTGNSRNLTDGGTSTNRPLESTAGPNSKQCARFDSTLCMLFGAAISNFVANNSAYMIFSCLINGGVSLNNSTMYTNHHLFGDGFNDYFGVFAKNVSGTTPTFFGYTWDGAEKDTNPGSAFSTATPYVVALRHESGTLALSVNGGTEITIAAGNTADLTNALRIATGAANNGADMSWFEGATWSAVPSSGNRSAIIADFKTWIGA